MWVQARAARQGVADVYTTGCRATVSIRGYQDVAVHAPKAEGLALQCPSWLLAGYMLRGHCLLSYSDMMG